MIDMSDDGEIPDPFWRELQEIRYRLYRVIRWEEERRGSMKRECEETEWVNCDFE